MTTNDSRSPSEISAWFTGRLPGEWTATQAAEVIVDREEITVIITLDPPDLTDAAAGADVDDAAKAQAVDGRIAGFREDTRGRRMTIAREAEHRFERKVSWGVRAGGLAVMFTHLAAPVMTRLRQPERLVLDTLVAASVARSRADALAWCVRLVGRNTDAWLTDLRTALGDVDRVRAEGPAE